MNKKENIGLIEVMVLAILPARLLDEIEIVKSHLLTKNFSNIEESCQKHKEWMEYLIAKHTITENNIEQIIKDEIGLVFYNVLSDCKILKKDKDFFFFYQNNAEFISSFIEKMLKEQLFDYFNLGTDK